MATGPDVSNWAYLLGGGFAGTAVKAITDYLKVRYRARTGDRRDARKDEVAGFSALVERLEKRLDSTEKKADAAEMRAGECERNHAVCTAQVAVLKEALNGALDKLHLPRLAMDGHTDG